jgi:4-hydroxy-3-methylbut-2-enyl diphosphate reductase
MRARRNDLGERAERARGRLIEARMNQQVETLPGMEIVLVRPRGFCAGVDRAIAIVERALEKFGPPVYVKHAIVHNRHVVENLERRGAVFVEDLARVPKGARVIFSAHGVPPADHQDAGGFSLNVLDATCPLVTKVHMEARRFAREDRTIFLIGHREHVEVRGTLGEAPKHIVVVGTVAEAETARAANSERVAFLTQTTLSLDDTRAIVAALRRRFPALVGPGKDDICYATQNRQNAVQALARDCDLVLVVGSPNSSNSNRLVEVAQARGVPAYLVDSRHELNEQWLHGARRIGITAGASAPEEVVRELVDYIARTRGARIVEREVVPEQVSFPMPAALAD